VLLTCPLPTAAETVSPDSPGEIATVPLRELDTVVFSQDTYMAWAGEPLCDQSGNVFIQTMPYLPPGSEEELPEPNAIMRISADGKTKTSFDPTIVTGFADARSVRTISAAVDKNGDLFVLVWVYTGDAEGEGGNYIVAFDKKAKPKSHVKIDPYQLIVQRFEVFGSGDFLLYGHRMHRNATRLAILPSGGGDIAEVVDSQSVDFEDSSPYALMTRGAAGRIYVAGQDGDGAIYAISAYGERENASFGYSREGSTLVAMPAGQKLVALMESKHRVAAVYFEAPSGDRAGRSWITVYDDVAGFGERQVVYGPVEGMPICYQRKGSRDRFTVLLGPTSLVTMSP
jgi:hypothetical protein